MTDESNDVELLEALKRGLKVDAKRPMTPAQFARKMKQVSDKYDSEGGHCHADGIIADLLEQLGYERGIAIYRAMTKWYA